MAIDNAFAIIPTALIAALTAWSISLYVRKKYPNLIFVICLALSAASTCIYWWPDKQFVGTTPNNTSFTAEAAFSPKQGAANLVIKTIQNANKYIYVAAYYFTSKPIADALLEAHDRGVDVKIVLDKGQQHARYNLIAYLNQSGIPVRINRKYKIMHNKFMIVDDTTLQLGSFNYTKDADERNVENVLVISNNIEIVASYLNQWQKLWLESQDLN